MSNAPHLSPKAPPRARRPSKTDPESSKTLTYALAGAAALLSVGGLYLIASELTKPTKKKRKKTKPTSDATGTGASTAAGGSKPTRPPGDYEDKEIERADGKPIGIAVCSGEKGEAGAFIAASKANVAFGLSVGSLLYSIDGERVDSLTLKEAAIKLGKSCSPKGKLVLRKNPDLAKKWHRAERVKNEGNQLFSKKQLDPSIAKYKEATDLHPTNKVYYTNKVLALLQKAKSEEGDKRTAVFNQAMADCRKIQELDVLDNYSKGHHVRGVVLLEMGNVEMARNAFQKVLTIDANNSAAKARLADCDKALAEKAEKAKKEAEQKNATPPKTNGKHSSAKDAAAKAAMAEEEENFAKERKKVCDEVVDKAIKDGVNKAMKRLKKYM